MLASAPLMPPGFHESVFFLLLPFFFSKEGSKEGISHGPHKLPIKQPGRSWFPEEIPLGRICPVLVLAFHPNLASLDF